MAGKAKTKAVEENSPMIEGTTRSGLKFSINSKVKDDARTLYYLTKMQDKSLDVSEQSKALFSLLELIFGPGDGLITFMNEVAYLHNGVADVASLTEELTDMFEAVKLKN